MRAVSTGEMLRTEVEDDSELGRGIALLLANGEYVSDEIVNRLIEKQLDQHSGAGLILDGYPRTLQQAEFLEAVMAARDLPPPAVIRLEVPVAAVVDRLSARRQCHSCGASFHLVQGPPRIQGVCDHCGSELIHRNDDEPAILAQRLITYQKLTEPVLAHYSRYSSIVDGTGTPDEVFARIRGELEVRVPVRSSRPHRN
jgi:adenylate kinase